MPTMTVILDGTGTWPDLQAKLERDELVHLDGDGPPIQVAMLPGGMRSGRSSVAIRIDLPDGRSVVAETSLSLFLAAAAAMRARDEALHTDPDTN